MSSVQTPDIPGPGTKGSMSKDLGHQVLHIFGPCVQVFRSGFKAFLRISSLGSRRIGQTLRIWGLNENRLRGQRDWSRDLVIYKAVQDYVRVCPKDESA